MSKRRVVVTGMGAVTPLGNDVKTTWGKILAGKSGVGPITEFDASAFSVKIAAEVKDFDVAPYMSVKEARKFDPFILYGVAAASQAVTDSGLAFDETLSYRAGCAIGSGIGGIGVIEKAMAALAKSGPRRISPFSVPGSIVNMLAGQVSMTYNLKGPSYAITTACTTGTHNIGMAARTIQCGDADVMVAGGSEMTISPVTMGSFAAARALSTRNDSPETASRPWDKSRDGFVMGSGAGMLVLEEYEHAKARGATIHAELSGFGMSSDAYHMTSPPENGDGAARAMASAIKDAGLSADQIDYINAHGTSTLVGDVAESRAVESVFGAHAMKLAMSSTKSMIGHMVGAAGAVEAIFSILSIRDQLAPPTINLKDVDESCVLNYVPGVAQAMKIRNVISNSFGFGGTNGSLLFSAV